MEDDDEEGDGDPEQHGQTPKMVAVLVHRYDVVLMRWGCNTVDSGMMYMKINSL
jgi:hypothetical protein